MTNKQIKDIVTKRLKKPVLAMVIFHLVGSAALHHMEFQGEVTVSLILMVVVLDIFFLMALMADLLVNVLTDLNDVNTNSSEQKAE